MNREKTFKRCIAILIVFLLLMSNCLPILSNISFGSEDGAENVEINGYFSGENVDNTNSLICDVDDETVLINFEINVKNGGYFKSGVIKFGDNLNFELNPDESYVIKENQMKLPEVNSSSNLKVSIPIRFREDEKYTSEDLHKINQITIKGEYIDDEGMLYVVEKTMDFELVWKQKTDTNLDLTIIKNLDFDRDGSKGRILQAELVVSGNIENRLPIKSTEIILDIPMADGLELENVSIDADRLSYTQGRKDYEANFTDANYLYENDKLNIKVVNNAVNEKYFKSYGEDKYIITFIYLGENPENIEKISNVKLSVINFIDEEEKSEYELRYNMAEGAGDVVKYYREHIDDTLSKGYLMANSHAETYNIDYIKKDILNVSRADLVAGLEVVDLDEYFIDANAENIYYTEDETSIMSTYTKTEFSRDNLLTVLGTDGWVEVLDMSDNVITDISLHQYADSTGLYVVQYDNPIGKVKFRFSDPENDGNISIVSTKTIEALNYSRDEIKTFSSLVNATQGYAIYDEGERVDLGIVSSGLDLTPIAADAVLEIENNEFDTTSVNESVNFKIKLNNNNDTSDLYENPVFEIRFPEKVTGVNLRNIDLFYTNGELELSNVESFVSGENQVVRITLEGSQKSYDINKETNGTVISFDADISVDELTQNETEEVRLNYYNRTSMNYMEQAEWNMDYYVEGNSVNGTATYPVKFKAPGGLINVQDTKVIETSEIVEPGSEDEEKMMAVKQAADGNLLEPGVGAKLATMYINVMNNTDKNFANFKILGRLPFIGNKDILTGEDLGTTVDTILDAEIRGEDLPFSVYYSENPEATANLYDEANNWKTDMYKVGGVRSYLIVLNDDCVLEPNKQLNFEYDYVIPANLVEGDAFYGMYVTYFKEGVTGFEGTIGSDKVGYQAPEMVSGISGELHFENNNLVHTSYTTLNVTIRNEGAVNARNVNILLDRLEGMIVEEVENGILDESNRELISIFVGDIPAYTEIVTVLHLYVNTITPETSISGLIDASNLTEQVAIASDSYVINDRELELIDSSLNTKCIADEEYFEFLTIRNRSKNSYGDVVVKKYFDSPMVPTYVELKEGQDEAVSYEIDQINRVITFTFRNVEPGYVQNVKYGFRFDYDLSYGTTGTLNILTTSMLGDKMFEYKNAIKYDQIKINVSKEIASDTSYKRKDETIEYVYYITNESNINARIHLKNELSNGSVLNGAVIDMNTNETKNYIPNVLTIPAKTTYKFIVYAHTDDSSCISNTLRVSDYNRVYANETYYSQKDGANNEGHQITGSVFSNTTGKISNGISGVIVDLYNANTNEKIASTLSDISGRYVFNNVVEDTYYVKFNYDDTKYRLKNLSTEMINENRSEVLKVNKNYMTDNIKLEDSNLSNVDLNLTSEDVFDMKIDLAVENMTVQNSAETSKFVNENSKLSKIDIDPSVISGSKVLIEYKVTVENQGTIPGSVDKIVDYLPEDMVFESSANPDWYMELDGNIYTRKLKNDDILPGETREIRLVLTKNMTDTNTGIVHNTVEIAATSNIRGMTDIDSIPLNGLSEDDKSYADSIIGIKTGITMNRLPIILTAAVVIIPLAFLVWKIIDKRRYV